MVRPVVWRPPAEPSPAELAVIKAVRRAKLFVFLRLHRHELFDEQFQAELAQAYVDSPKGQPPVPPARLALATILQAYTGVSDDEVIEAAVMDRRWQLVLDCMGAEEPPFSKGTLVGFRKRLIEKNLDRRLIERTVELAAATGGFGARVLRAALDSSPLWGAGRVEDTFNLMGHALRKALGVIAVLQGRGQAAGTAIVAAQAGVPQLGASSLKAALDADWDDLAARDHALAEVLGLLDRVDAFVAGQAGDEATAAVVATARQVRDQDIDLAGPAPALRRGVAKDRRISVEDAEMRHGRKSRSVLSGGYKRHVIQDLDTGLVPAVGITPANAPEASVAGDVVADLEAAGWHLSELHIDRAYLSSALVRDRSPDLAIFCKAWRVRNASGRFAKDQFTLDFAAGQLTCPAGVSMPFEPGRTVRFPAGTCAACPLQARCTASSNGRSVSIHPDEALLAELRRRQQTPDGRAKLRERVAVEHVLAHVGHWQGRRARYRGTRKNLFDLRRVAVVHNLHVIARQPTTDSYQFAA
jgi:IS5 family transposase